MTEEKYIPRLYGRQQDKPLKPRQARLMESLLPQIAVPMDGAIDPKLLFPQAEEIHLEIGFGGGEHLAWQAAHHPKAGFIGAEPFVNGVGKLLGLPYPAGPVIDRLAGEGRPAAHDFPSAMADQSNFDFSFSGLKTALVQHVQQHGPPDSRQALVDLCASFQAAVADVLVLKARRAVAHAGRAQLDIAGGVAANSGLRERATAAASEDGFEAVLAARRYCGDNAAMIAAAAAARIAAGVAPSVDVHTAVALDDPRMALP